MFRGMSEHSQHGRASANEEYIEVFPLTLSGMSVFRGHGHGETGMLLSPFFERHSLWGLSLHASKIIFLNKINSISFNSFVRQKGFTRL